MMHSPKILPVEYLLNPFTVTNIDIWKQEPSQTFRQQLFTRSITALTQTTQDIRGLQMNSIVETTNKSVQQLQTVSNSPTSVHKTADIAVKIQLDSSEKLECLRTKNRRGRIPLHPEMSPRERATWRLHRNRQAAARSRQKQKEYICQLEGLLEQAKITIAVLRNNCITDATMLQQDDQYSGAKKEI